MCRIKILETKMDFKEVSKYLERNNKYKLTSLECVKEVRKHIRTSGKNRVQDIWYNGSMGNNPDSGRSLSIYLENGFMRTRVQSHSIKKLVVLEKRTNMERIKRWLSVT